MTTKPTTTSPPIPSQLPLGPFPESESYDYLIITLPNGLTCLLISTHREDLARRASWYSMGTDGPEGADEKKQIENLASRVARFDSYTQMISGNPTTNPNNPGGGDDYPARYLGSSRRISMMQQVLAANTGIGGDGSHSGRGGGGGGSGRTTITNFTGSRQPILFSPTSTTNVNNPNNNNEESSFRTTSRSSRGSSRADEYHYGGTNNNTAPNSRSNLNSFDDIESSSPPNSTSALSLTDNNNNNLITTSMTNNNNNTIATIAGNPNNGSKKKSIFAPIPNSNPDSIDINSNSGRRLTVATGAGGGGTSSGRQMILGAPPPPSGLGGARQSFYSNPSDSTKRGNSYLAAASLCVGVGNYSDPSHIQGLAHVVEHMVFMGSSAYPVENDWDQFMAIAGGESNASTESERTTFHFSVPRESFEEGLDRFSHFFIDPLLHRESLERELAAINSEFHDSASEPAFLLAEIMSASAKHGPFQQFACGNSTSLDSVENLHENLTYFFNTHYIAPNMTAVLYSSDTIESLTLTAQNTFGKIPNIRSMPKNIISSSIKLPPRFDGKISGLPFLTPQEIIARGLATTTTPPPPQPTTTTTTTTTLSQPQPPTPNLTPGLDGYVTGCIFLIDPPAGYPHTLQITWQLPSQLTKWRSKCVDYIGNAIGHETNGSVLKECKARGWATGLMSTGDCVPESSNGLENNSACTLFQVFIVLTEVGVLEWVKVVQLLFEYIGMLLRDGVQKWLYEELRKCALAGYLFRDVPNPALYVEALAQRMCNNSQLPRERVVNGSELFGEYDEQGIRDVLAALSPENAKYDLITRLVRLCPPTLWETVGTTSQNSTHLKKSPDTTIRHPSIVLGTPVTTTTTSNNTNNNNNIDDDGNSSTISLPGIRLDKVGSIRTDISGAITTTTTSHTSMGQSTTELGGGNHLSSSLDIVVDKILVKKLKRHVFGPLAQTCKYISYRERWYGTPYAAGIVPAPTMDIWNQALRRGKAGASKFAKLPPRNEYICEDFYVKAVPRPTLSTGLVGFTFDLAISGARVSVVDYNEHEALVQYTKDNIRFWVPYDAHSDPPTINKEPFRHVDGIDIQVTRANDAPALVRSSPLFSLWHLQGGQFSSSRCELHIALEFPRNLVGGKPIESAMADLILVLFEDATVVETYPAFLSGTYLETEFIDGNKFVLVYSGFPSSVQLLVERTLPMFLGCAKLGIREIAHRNQKVLLAAQIEALMAVYTNYDVPFSSTLDSVLRLDSVDPMAKRQALATSVSRSKLHKFALSTVSQCHATALYYGNCDRKDCLSLANKVDALMHKYLGGLNNKITSPRLESIRPTFKIPGVALRTKQEREALGGTGVSGLFSLYTASGPSSSVLVYFQIDAPSPKHRHTQADVKTRLLCELIVQLMREPLFNSLRTQKKLAYHVTCAHHELDPPGVQGIFFEIQSHHVTTLKLVDIVDDFLIEFDKELRKLSSVEFERHIRALCLRKMERDPGPTDEARRHFSSILVGNVQNGTYTWNRNKEDAKLLLSGLIKKENAEDFFDTFLNPDRAPSRRRLNLLVMGAFEIEAGGHDKVVEILNGIENAHILGPSDGFMIMKSLAEGAAEENMSKTSVVKVTAGALLSPGGLVEFIPVEELPPRPQKSCWLWWS
jgi:secreted Zn-dependent insulinase-like peptidase